MNLNVPALMRTLISVTFPILALRQGLARYGGEEFVAILQGTTSADAIRIAEDVRAALERSPVDIGTGSPVRVTVSAGCAHLGDDEGVSAGLSLADVWLARAKRAGRNQVVGLSPVPVVGG